MIDKRICTTCKIEKPFDEFGNYKKGKWGKREKCKDCRRIENREYAKDNPEKRNAKHKRWADRHRDHVREYNRNYYEKNPEPYKASAIAYRKKVENQNIKSYRQRYPEKKKAHTYVELALFFGHMSKPNNCSRCQISCNPQGHHEDYAKPLDVIWLCTKCHGFVHRKENANHRKRLSEKTSQEEATV